MSAPDFRPLATIRAEIKAQRWEVHVEQVDDRVHVYPVCGLMSVEGFLNRYPRTERGVRRAIRRTQRWCDRENAKLDRGAALMEKFEAQR